MTRPFSPCLPRLFALRQSRTLHDIPYRPCLRFRPSTIPNVTLPSIPASTRRNLPCQYAVCLNYRSSPALPYPAPPRHDGPSLPFNPCDFPPFHDASFHSCLHAPQHSATFHSPTHLASPASTLHSVPIRSPTVPSSPALDFQFAPNRFPPIRYMSNLVTPFLQFQAICLIKQSQIIQSLIPPIALNQVALLQFQLVAQPLQLNSQCRLPLAFQRHI